ncbi:uncharacterized protein EV420DRAFT_1634954 [Desarmillaria tabescens]|uniref:Ribonuclease H1 N-terminal domain-containing protein n=1 Tax=Armillaria tabescens TaxID=1929756 RepID=A0AA39TVJ1_ARMTA|nr:uncharacterized protein EV420DRAFT_1634954 [Desarmillaria tabescens]KAK0467698.1 hypothetical protein EV420DRAFT_1634954 [Desarmillaria tabescens]
MASASRTVPSQSSVTPSALMAALANLNLSAGGATLSTTTTTTTSNTLHLPASNTIGGTSTLPAAAPPPVTAASTATVGTPSTTSSITITTPAPSTAGSTPAATTTMTTPSRAKRPVYRIPRPEDLPRPRNVWPPQNNFYVITSGQEVGLFFTWNETAEQVIGIPGNKYEWRANYYDAVDIYRKAYDDDEVHVTPSPAPALTFQLRTSGAPLIGLAMTRIAL